MTDFLSPAERSAAMRKVRSRDTSIELVIRRAAFARGLRYRTHFQPLPGKPDMAFIGARVVVFLDGDFWHGREFQRTAHRLTKPWRAKIERNIERDREQDAALEALGWQVLRFWQSEIKSDPSGVVDQIEAAVAVRRRVQPRSER